MESKWNRTIWIQITRKQSWDAQASAALHLYMSGTEAAPCSPCPSSNTESQHWLIEETQTEENRLSSSVPTNSYDTAVGCLSQLKTKQTENNNRRAVGTVGMPVIPALRKLWQNRFSVTVIWVTQRKTLSQKEVLGGEWAMCLRVSVAAKRHHGHVTLIKENI